MIGLLISFIIIASKINYILNTESYMVDDNKFKLLEQY